MLKRSSGRFIDLNERLQRIIIGTAILALTLAVGSGAEEVLLKNGDRITGTIVSDNASVLKIQSDALGMLSIDRAFVQSPAYIQRKVSDEDRQEAAEENNKRRAAEWLRKLSLGYQHSGGNTRRTSGRLGVQLNRKTEMDEWTARTSLYYSSSENKMDAQKSYGFLRYAHFFSEKRIWYHFYKLEIDHDRFANIDYRLLPLTGLGYWFSDASNNKLIGELAAGYELTSYRDGSPSSDQAVLTPHIIYQKQLFKGFRFEADSVMYFPFESFEQYRLRSEHSFVHALTEKISWRISLIDEFNAAAEGDAKKNDYRVVYTLEYGF